MFKTSRGLRLTLQLFMFAMTPTIYIFGMTPDSYANELCAPNSLSEHPENVLQCYISKHSLSSPRMELMELQAYKNVDIYHYNLISQFWPESPLSSTGKEWQHRLTIYVPNKVKHEHALLYVNGGTNQPQQSQSHVQQDSLSFAEIAIRNASIVADLKDVPNQYLVFDDGVPRKEDDIVAYSWNQYMDDPANNAYWSAHLPMVNSVVKAMDAIEAASLSQEFDKPTSFVLAGASKRGWAAWLTSVVDERVRGLIPIVADLLNTDSNIRHIHDSLGDWPLAFYDYVSQGVVDRIDTPEFAKLMRIEDTLAYIERPEYAARLAIPKFIINASSDDFFVPDSLLQYIEQLPGENVVRILPNQPHYVDSDIISKALNDYYAMFLAKHSFPNISWVYNEDRSNVVVSTDFIPDGEAILWSAHNSKSRDFRIFPTDIRYQSEVIEGQCVDNQCTFHLPEEIHAAGWTSRFIEFNYKDDGHNLTVTSPAFISPNVYPSPTP